MNNNIKEYRTDRLIKLGLINISITDSINCADLNLHYHTVKWLTKQFKILGHTILEQYVHGSLVTVYFK